MKEQLCLKVTNIYFSSRHNDLAQLVQQSRPLMANFSKAKSAKIGKYQCLLC